MMANNNDKIFVFRRYKKREGDSKKKHPKLIVDITNQEYGYMGLTEHRKKGKHHNNIHLTKNPKEGDLRQANLRKKVKYDVKDNFGDILKNYKLSKEDKKYIINYLSKKKKRWPV